MTKGLFIIGTDTDVGKTFVVGGLTYILREHGFNACSLKPVQSGGEVECGQLVSPDIKFVKELTGLDEDEKLLNPYCLKEPVSPHLAARVENIIIEREKLIAAYHTLSQKYQYIIVEGAGGIAVPLVESSYFMYDLIKDLNIPAVLVARTGVGTINHTLLTLEFAKNQGIDVRGIILNGYQGSFYEDDNIGIIESISGVPIVGVIDKLEDNKEKMQSIREEFHKRIDVNELLKLFA